VVGIFIKNNNNKLVIYRRWLVKGRRNLSAYKPILASNNNIKEITVNNGKLLQLITKPKGIY